MTRPAAPALASKQGGCKMEPLANFEAQASSLIMIMILCFYRNREAREQSLQYFIPSPDSKIFFFSQFFQFAVKYPDKSSSIQ